MKRTTIDFLYILKENNNREWFQANKNLYEDARTDFEQFVESLIPVVQSFEPRITNLAVKETMFRIYRDVRFSKDKTPYKTYFGSYIAPGGRKSIYCGYYMHIEPGNCFLAGGAYRPQSEYLKNIRSEIYYNLKGFEEILNDATFKKTFGQIVGEKLKRPPKGFPAEFGGVELLKFKDFTIFHQLDELQLLSKDFGNYAVNIFKKMKPLNDFINRALD